MWRGHAEEKTAFGKGGCMSGAEWGVLVTRRVLAGYGEQRDRLISTKLIWWDAG